MEFAPVVFFGATGRPRARARASSSISLTFLISSFRSRAAFSSGVSLDGPALSPPSPSSPSAFAYQVRSLPFAQRPTGAFKLWPR